MGGFDGYYDFDYPAPRRYYTPPTPPKRWVVVSNGKAVMHDTEKEAQAFAAGIEFNGGTATVAQEV